MNKTLIENGYEPLDELPARLLAAQLEEPPAPEASATPPAAAGSEQTYHAHILHGITTGTFHPEPSYPALPPLPPVPAQPAPLRLEPVALDSDKITASVTIVY